MNLGYLLFVQLIVQLVLSEDNGLGLTPAMGFMNWQRFRCQTDCTNFPDECLHENLFKSIADAMVSLGLRDAGYTYVAIDDCWLMKRRSEDGLLEADPKLFPSGIKSLADYMHKKGLKLGIYADVGSQTCAGFAGSNGFEKTDAQTFASWGIDMLKYDGCHIDPKNSGPSYKKMAKALIDSGRDILYICAWIHKDYDADYAEVGRTCNIFRNYVDVADSWDSVIKIINYYAKHQDQFTKYSGPGHFIDPDELLIGDPGTSFGQQKIQMSMWCMWSAPLLVSSDLRSIDDASLSLLLNRYLIRINQDPLGLMAKQVKTSRSGHTQIWLKSLGDESLGKYAICVFREGSDDQSTIMTFSLKDLGVSKPENDDIQFKIFDIFTEQNFAGETVSWDKQLEVYVHDFDAIVWIVKLNGSKTKDSKLIIIEDILSLN